jgi:hypothetical protein
VLQMGEFDAFVTNLGSKYYYHFRHAVDAGLIQGREVGNFVAGNALRPLR